MSWSIENVEGNAKKLFQGKRKWIFIGGAALVVVLLLVMKKKSAASTDEGAVTLESYPQTGSDYTGAVTGGTAAGGGVTSDDLALLRDNFSQQVSDLQASIQQNQNDQTAALQSLAAATTSSLSDLSSQWGSQLQDLQSDFSQQIDHASKIQPDINISPSGSSTPLPSGVSEPSQAAPAPTTTQASPPSSTYSYTEGGIHYQVTSEGNIFKNGTYIPATNDKLKYLPSNVVQAASAAHKANA